MIPKDCKRLAEVDFPIAVVSKHSAAEKEARCGHVPKVHIWPAARPTSACRAMLMALLLPDPCATLCPADFKQKARELLCRFPGKLGATDEELRKALLKFIGDFANWDLSSDAQYLKAARGLVKAAHPEETPLVVDPFAGGGSIPLEALRLGCEAFASDLNPVACLVMKAVLEDIPGHGLKLVDALRSVGTQVKKASQKELAKLYPPDPDGAQPITYLWARALRCESPNCGAEIPLVRSFWLVKKANRRRALRYSVERPRGKPPFVKLEIFEPKSDQHVPVGTVTGAKATCPCCNTVLPASRVCAQLAAQRGGADVVFDLNGHRAGGATILAVVTLKENATGRQYRLPTDRDYAAVHAAQQAAVKLPKGAMPDEPLPPVGTLGFRVQRYGMLQWGDLFTARQKVALAAFVQEIAALGECADARRLTALCLSKMVDMNNSLATWQAHAEIPAHMLTRFAIPMKWDFAEAVPISESSGTLDSAIKRTTEAFPNLVTTRHGDTVHLADACSCGLPDDSAGVWFTDPPYYDAVPYSDLSDFFFVWIKRTLPNHPLLRDPFDPKNPLTPKLREAVQDEVKLVSGRPKDRAFFEDTMGKAFAEGRRVLMDDGVGCVVFAHKTTEGWEALLSGMIRGGWVITGSWPIATEMGSRLRARDSAALATSVHLVCRPRPGDAPVGDWGDVLRELPKRVGDWMERLQAEGIRGADLVFACIGPALEIFSRYAKVETAEGGEVKLPVFLEKVWEVVGRTALEQILGTAEAKARNGAAGAVEEDARLTALFLWTLQSTNAESANGRTGESANEESEKHEDEGEDDDESRAKAKGFSLVFDVVRRFAQPLGIHLPEWEGRVIETKKGVVRLLSVEERAQQLFGDAGVGLAADRIEAQAQRDPQFKFGFEKVEQPSRLPPEASQRLALPYADDVAGPEIKGRRSRKGAAKGVSDESLRTRREATTLDRVHAAMLLQAGGRANALRALLKAEQDRGPDFLRLANALSALYPTGSEEKRLLDAMLLAAPR